MLQAGVRGRGARARSEALAAETGRRRPRRARRHHLARGRQASTMRSRCSTAARSRPCASRSTCPTTACSTRSACSTPGPLPGPINFRGVRLGVPICEDIWSDEVVRVPGRRRARKSSSSPNGSPFDWPKPDVRMNVAVARVDRDAACRSSTSTRSAARTSWCSTAPRSCSMPTCSLAVQMPAWEEAVALADMGARRGGWRCEPGERAAARGGRCGRLSRLRAGPARLRRQERLSRRRARACRAASIRALVAAHGGRRARARARALRDAALPLHLEREPVAMRRPAPRRSACATTSCRSPTPVEGFVQGAAPSCSPARQPDITEENLQSRARGTIADGDLQQVRLAWC